MSKKKERLYKYLKRRNYLNLEARVADNENHTQIPSKRPSAGRDRKITVNAIKRFQRFSGLPTTGRANESTLLETERPRCGFPDLDPREILLMNEAPSRWNTPNITYGFRNFTQQLPVSLIRNAVGAAFSIWKQAFPPFMFREIPMEDNPLIVVLFVSGPHGDNIDFRGADGDLAHAFLPNSPVLPGDIHFDNAEKWSLDTPATNKDLLTVAIHEIGHSLGLVHSTNPEAQMFATYRGLRRALHAEDLARIRTLYS